MLKLSLPNSWKLTNLFNKLKTKEIYNNYLLESGWMLEN